MYLKFTGADGSMGLKHGGVYKVKIITTDRYIVVEWIENYETNHGTRRCPYSSLAKLNENWSDS